LERRRVELEEALREARPYVFGRIYPPGHPARDWRAETAESVLARVDVALASQDSEAANG
jgi:hypothetical protein